MMLAVDALPRNFAQARSTREGPTRVRHLLVVDCISPRRNDAHRDGALPAPVARFDAVWKALENT